MARPQAFYQLGGFGAQTNRWGEPWNSRFLGNNLAVTVGGPASPLWKDDRINLVLGMKIEGSIYLLIRAEDMAILLAHYQLPPPPRNPAPFLPTDYGSLSPILFASLSALERKMRTLRSVPGKQKYSTPMDMSQANKSFSLKENSIHCGKRNAFEHARVLWRILGNEISLQEWCYPGCLWNGKARITGLMYTSWKAPTKDDQLLDVAWTQPTASRESIHGNRTTHIRLSDTLLLFNKGSKEGKIKFGQTEKGSKAEAAARLRLTISSSHTPVILLVFKAEATLHALEHALGIDTANWEVGLKGLLGYPNYLRDNAMKTENKSDLQYSGPSSHRTTRSRSRSPSRSHLTTSRRRSPYRPAGPVAPVYVLDVHGLYQILVGQFHQKRGLSLKEVCAGTGVEYSTEGEWCAGNDVHLLPRILQSLASGPPIGERREMIPQLSSSNPSASTSAAQALSTMDEPPSDDEDLTNEAPAVNLFGDASGQGSSAAPARPKSTGNFWDDIEDDDDDW